jgi:hypothetical protein
MKVLGEGVKFLLLHSQSTFLAGDNVPTILLQWLPCSVTIMAQADFACQQIQRVIRSKAHRRKQNRLIRPKICQSVKSQLPERQFLLPLLLHVGVDS